MLYWLRSVDVRIVIFDQVHRILRGESREIREDLQDILEKLELGLPIGLSFLKSLTNIHPQLFEIRLKDQRGQFRVVYYVKKKDALYLLHAFRKKTQKLPEKEKKVILQRLKRVL